MKKIKKRNKYVGGGMTPYLKTDYRDLLPQKIEPISSSSGGGMNLGGIGQAGDAITSIVGNMTGPATATTVSESRMQTAMNSIGGAAKGASAGFAVGGPVGAIVGGVAGLASGVIGNKGTVTTSKNVYDDNVDVKFGTGIRGGKRNRKKLLDKAETLRRNARSNQASLAMATANEQEFLEDYDSDIQTMAQGGMTSSLAYVDDGELLNMPQGGIAEVPEEGKPTDSNLVNLPEGTRILSDKRKVPGSKETFAQMGKRLMSKKVSKRKDKYAENAAKLNLMNDLIIYDRLFTIQEMSKKGKSDIKRFAKGGRIASVAGDLLTDVAALAPAISNLYTKPESFNATFNPYEGQIRQTMARRKFNIDPVKRTIRENRAIGNYNASNYNPSTGANLAYRLQSQIAADKAISDLYSNASNINNQYAGEYANTLNNLGQLRVLATNMATDMNARSRSAARNIQRQGLTQLGQYGQNKKLMSNQKNMDEAMLKLYEPFLQAGFAEKVIKPALEKFLKR